jgi:hypothetical protein
MENKTKKAIQCNDDVAEVDRGIECFDVPETLPPSITGESRTQMGRVETKTVSEQAMWTACLAHTCIKEHFEGGEENRKKYIEDVKALLWNEVKKAWESNADFFREFAQCLDLKCNAHEWNKRQLWLLHRLCPNGDEQTVFLTIKEIAKEYQKEKHNIKEGAKETEISDIERTIKKDLKRIGTLAKNSPKRRGTTT